MIVVSVLVVVVIGLFVFQNSVDHETVSQSVTRDNKTLIKVDSIDIILQED